MKLLFPQKIFTSLKLPDEMIGKEIEVIAFNLSDKYSASSNKEVNAKQYKDAIAFFKKNAVDFSKIKKWSREDLYE